MMSVRRWLGVVCAVSAGFASGCARDAGEPLPASSLLLASLQSETLIPNRHGGCESFFGVEQGAAGELCVSESCGFGEAVLRVDRTLVGSVAGEQGVLRYALGEWCEPEFPLSGDPLLVAVDRYDADHGTHEFRFERTFQTERGDWYFVPQVITAIDGVDLTALAKPLPEPLVYGEVAEFADEEIAELEASGFVERSDDLVAALRGVYIDDLVEAVGAARP